MALEEDLESRMDWKSNRKVELLGDVFILEPLEKRGQILDFAISFSWGPCFAILRWQMGSCYCHVAVRPSPPYRTWAKDHLAPVTWHAAVTHSDKTLDRLRGPRGPPNEPSSSSNSAPKAAPPVIHRPQLSDGFCQVDFETRDNFAQTAVTQFADFGVGPDLVHLQTDLVVYRPIEFFHPPWPVVWIVIFDSSGVIHGVRWTMPTPVEDEIHTNVSPQKLPTN